MIKVMHLITGLNTGGAEMMLKKVLSGIDSSKFDNVVVSMIDKGTLGADIEELGIGVYTLNMNKGILDFKKVLKLIHIIKKEKPDILQTWMYHADLIGLICGKITGVKRILWNLRVSNIDMKKYSTISKLVLKLLVIVSGFPDAILVNSNAGLQFHERLGYKPKNWELAYNGFDTSKFNIFTNELKADYRGKIGLPKDSMLIGMIARFDPMKDHENFLNAVYEFKRVYSKEKQVHFVLVGREIEWQNLYLANLINGLGLKEVVYLLGERKDVSSVIAAMDIITSSSYGEGFSNVIGEAMASGIPCVVTDVGDSAQIVNDTGLVVPPKNPVDIAHSWIRLIEMTVEERNKMGLRARKRVIENYDIVNIIKHYEDIYERYYTNS